MDEVREPGLREVLAVSALFALVALAMTVTYAHLPAEDLYRVSGRGLEAGLSRMLVFLNYSFGLVAPALAFVAAARAGRRGAVAGAALAAGLCAAVVVPGVVDQADLDARPVNAIAATGVLMAFGLTGWAWATRGLGPPHPLRGWDYGRIALAVVLLVAALPWIAAELGFFLDGVPVLGSVFLTGELVRDPGGTEVLAAVHLGHHHGLDGVLLAWSALLLSRPVARMAPGPLRAGLAAYLSLMLVYGLANALQDFWLEQLVKRGVTGHAIPSLIRPDASAAWAAMLVAAVAIYFAFRHVGRVRQPSQRRFP